MNPDHDITRDPPDDEPCADCEGTGEIVTGGRKTLPCPTCMWQEHEADVSRLIAAMWCALAVFDDRRVPDGLYAKAYAVAREAVDRHDPSLCIAPPHPGREEKQT